MLKQEANGVESFFKWLSHISMSNIKRMQTRCGIQSNCKTTLALVNHTLDTLCKENLNKDKTATAFILKLFHSVKIQFLWTH